MNIDKLSYEKAVDELEKLIDQLENKDNTLKDSVEKFERGIELYKHCNNILSKAEGEIKVLISEDNSKFIEQEFMDI